MQKLTIFGLLGFFLLACCCGLCGPYIAPFELPLDLPFDLPDIDMPSQEGGGKGESLELFTRGDLTDIPRYPGARQETVEIEIPFLLKGYVQGLGQSAWKLYITEDKPAKVLDWYQKEMPRRGWQSQTALDAEESGMLIFVKGENKGTGAFILIGEDKGRTNIIIVRGEKW